MSKFRSLEQMHSILLDMHKRGLANTPYVLRYEKDSQKLVFFGSSHSNNPNHPQFKELDSIWKEFLSSTQKAKSIIFHEGFHFDPDKDRQVSIKRHAEVGYTIFLADKAGRKSVSGDPDRKAEAEFLQKKFGKQEVVLYYLVRQIPQWQRERPQPDFNGYLQYTLDRYKEFLGWPPENFDIDRLKKIFHQKTGIWLRRNLTKSLWPLHFPYYSKVSGACSKYRNEHFFEQIKSYWQSGYSIFIVYGGGHAVTLEPALYELTTGKNWGEL